MQVSNSTGRNTDYRVGASGGGSNINYAASSNVLLAPGETYLCANAWPNTVEFWIDGQKVASQTFSEDPGQVALFEGTEGFQIQVTPCATDDGSVAA